MIKIPQKYSHEYVCCLPIELEQAIMQEVKKEVAKLHLSDSEKEEAIENANNEKICNLTDTINFEWV